MSDLKTVLCHSERARENSSLLSFAEFLEASETQQAVIEAWVACTVVESRTVTCEARLTLMAAAQSPPAPETVCAFPDITIFRLQARHSAEVLWDEMVGSTLALRLIASPGEMIQVTDVASAWIEDQIRATNRAWLREMAEAGQLDLQHALAEPSDITRIGIICADAALVAKAQKDFAELGVGVSVLPAEFDGSRGRMSLIGALTRAETLVADGAVDLLMLIHEGGGRDGLFALQDDQTASLICEIGVPVVIGARRPSCGSLVHQVAFAAYDSAAEALQAVQGLVQRSREAEAKQARIDVWNERLRQRLRERG